MRAPRFQRCAITACAVAMALTPAAPGESLRRPSTRPPDAADSSLPESTTERATLALADAPKVERQTLNALLAGTWPRRALTAIRLERFGCEESRAILANLLDDESWQVRAFATRSLGRRREAAREDWFVSEPEPRVIRAALRHRYPVDLDRLTRGVEFLTKQNGLEDKMLAVELAAASEDESLRMLAEETIRTVILRMGRADAGALSPRLATVTGGEDLRRHFRWQHWLRRQGRPLPLHGAFAVPAGEAPLPLSPIAQLDSERFASLESYLAELSSREVDLAICLDCTASMSGEIAAAQGGADDMMLFIGDVCASVRFGLVAYRDRRDREVETAAADFTSDIHEARRRLWMLDAEGGGDTPELVYDAMLAAFTRLSWSPQRTKALVVIGDAPPHVGRGLPCVQLAARGAEVGITTHTVQAEGKPVKHFPEIAQAGRGRCVSLENDDELVAEITGLAIGERFADEFAAFFRVYLELCR